MPRALLVAVLSAFLLLPSAAHASASGVVVSQVYGGGGNSGASFRNDYVELFNAGAAAVDLSDWTVQYATAAGTSWQTTSLSGTVRAGGLGPSGMGSEGVRVAAALASPPAARHADCDDRAA